MTLTSMHHRGAPFAAVGSARVDERRSRPGVLRESWVERPHMAACTPPRRRVLLRVARYCCAVQVHVMVAAGGMLQAAHSLEAAMELIEFVHTCASLHLRGIATEHADSEVVTLHAVSICCIRVLQQPQACNCTATCSTM